jgi:deoxyribonuclease V
LGLREAFPIAEAVQQLETSPDLLLVEGHGTAHPRRFGAACHVGVLTELPTVGVAKNRLVGRCGDVPAAKGEWVPLIDGGEVVGAVLRTREGVKPVYVSPGLRVGLEAAVEHTFACCRRYRMPEPIRRAHQLAREGLTREA